MALKKRFKDLVEKDEFVLAILFDCNFGPKAIPDAVLHDVRARLIRELQKTTVSTVPVSESFKKLTNLEQQRKSRNMTFDTPGVCVFNETREEDAMVDDYFKTIGAGNSDGCALAFWTADESRRPQLGSRGRNKEILGVPVSEAEVERCFLFHCT